MGARPTASAPSSAWPGEAETLGVTGDPKEAGLVKKRFG